MSRSKVTERQATKSDNTLVTVTEENALSDANIDDIKVRSSKSKERPETKKPEIILNEHENNFTSIEPSNVTFEILNQPQILVSTLDTDGRKMEMTREEVDRTQTSYVQHNILNNKKNQTVDEDKVNNKVNKDGYTATIEPSTILGT